MTKSLWIDCPYLTVLLEQNRCWSVGCFSSLCVPTNREHLCRKHKGSSWTYYTLVSVRMKEFLKSLKAHFYLWLHTNVAVDYRPTEICFISMDLDSGFLLLWLLRTTFFSSLQLRSGPFQQPCVLSQWLVRFVSLALLESPLGRVYRLEPVFSRAGESFCMGNQSTGCCLVPTIRWENGLVNVPVLSRRHWWNICFQHKRKERAGELSLQCDHQCWLFPVWVSLPQTFRFRRTAWPCLTLTSLPVLLFCIFHHAHILEKHACHSMLSRIGLAFGVAAAFGAFVAGNCNVSTALLLDWFISGRLNSQLICIQPTGCDTHWRSANICSVTSDWSKVAKSDCCYGSDLTSVVIPVTSALHSFWMRAHAPVFQPGDLPMLHNLGAALSFLCICFYTTILSTLTRLCVLSGYERILSPLRIASAVLQIIATILCILHEVSFPIWEL